MAKSSQPAYGRDPARPAPQVHEQQVGKSIAAAVSNSAQHVASVTAASKK